MMIHTLHRNRLSQRAAIYKVTSAIIAETVAAVKP
jgi:hypothetical protein